MNCIEARAQFPAVLDGMIALSEWAPVEAHVNECATCRKTLERLYQAKPKRETGWAYAPSRPIVEPIEPSPIEPEPVAYAPRGFRPLESPEIIDAIPPPRRSRWAILMVAAVILGSGTGLAAYFAKGSLESSLLALIESVRPGRREPEVTGGTPLSVEPEPALSSSLSTAPPPASATDAKSSAEATAAETRAAEIKAAETKAAEDKAAEARAAEAKAAEMKAAEVKAAEMKAAEARAAEMKAAEARAAEMKAAEAKAAEMKAAEAKAAETRAAETKAAATKAGETKVSGAKAGGTKVAESKEAPTGAAASLPARTSKAAQSPPTLSAAAAAPPSREPVADPNILVETGKVDVAVQVSVANRKDAERDLTLLLTRVGGTKLGRSQNSTSTFITLVPRSSYSEFTRGLTQIGPWQLEAGRSTLPDPVHVSVKLAK